MPSGPLSYRGIGHRQQHTRPSPSGFHAYAFHRAGGRSWGLTGGRAGGRASDNESAPRLIIQLARGTTGSVAARLRKTNAEGPGVRRGTSQAASIIASAKRNRLRKALSEERKRTTARPRVAERALSFGPLNPLLGGPAAGRRTDTHLPYKIWPPRLGISKKVPGGTKYNKKKGRAEKGRGRRAG